MTDYDRLSRLESECRRLRIALVVLAVFVVATLNSLVSGGSVLLMIALPLLRHPRCDLLQLMPEGKFSTSSLQCPKHRKRFRARLLQQLGGRLLHDHKGCSDPCQLFTTLQRQAHHGAPSIGRIDL